MLMSALGIIVERNVFCLLFKLELSGGGQTLGEGGLAVKLMRKSPRFQHGLRVNAGRLRKSCVHRERRRSGLLARLVGYYKQLLFSLKIIVKWNVGSLSDGGLQSGLLGWLACGSGSFCRGSHQAIRRLYSGGAHAEQER